MPHKLIHHPLMHRLRNPASAMAGVAALRLAVGIAFAWHGYGKLFGGLDGTTMFFGKLGIPLPGLLAPLVAVVEFVGGLGLILGLGTRFWSAGHAIIMIVAILKAKGLSTFKGFELEFLLLGASLGLVLMGPGAYSLDDRILKKIEKKESEQKKPQASS